VLVATDEATRWLAVAALARDSTLNRGTNFLPELFHPQTTWFATRRRSLGRDSSHVSKAQGSASPIPGYDAESVGVSPVSTSVWAISLSLMFMC
jgi:hypothetical protein